jgi:hypothetical protein
VAPPPPRRAQKCDPLEADDDLPGSDLPAE